METMFKAFAWLVIGILLGFAVYFVFLQPPRPAPADIAMNPPIQELNDTLPQVLESGSVNLTMIDAPDCDACNSEGLMLQQARTVLLKSEFLTTGTVERLPFSSGKAQALILKYNLTTLPAVLVEGDVGRDAEFVKAWTESIGTLEGSAALVTRIKYPPYYNITSGKVTGLAKAIGIRASGCAECGDPDMFISSLESSSIGMVFVNKTIYEEDDSGAQALMARYNITKLPALLLSENGTSDYPVFKQIEVMGTVEDGWFILREMTPPYVDLSSGRAVRGLVSATYIVNSSCEDCFEITSLSDYLSQTSGVYINDSRAYEADSAEGKALVQKYNITMIPTLIFSNDAKYYYKFEEAWAAQNNTLEPDGSFVFRAHGMLGGIVYQNISG